MISKGFQVWLRNAPEIDIADGIAASIWYYKIDVVQRLVRDVLYEAIQECVSR